MPSHHPDRLSPQLRTIESEIDNAYRASPLIRLTFATAGWNLLAVGEDIFLKPHLRGDEVTVGEVSIIADNFVTGLTYPLYWLYSSCPRGGQPLFRYNDDHYQAARNLLNLGESYKAFCSAFTYASRGLMEINLEGSILIPVHDFQVESQYEAYNRLIKQSFTSQPPSDTSELTELIRQSLRVEGERLYFKLNPTIAKAAKNLIGPVLRKRFSLPESWQFSHYSLGDFRQVSETVIAIAFAHWLARFFAAAHGCIGLGYADCIYVAGREELLRRTANYSGIEESIVSYILNDLTYGSAPGPLPDPALQPLIPLNSELYAVMPNLWIHGSAERNFTVLLNRLPGEKEKYSRLVSEKESLMKKKLETSLSQSNLRFVSGDIPGRSDLPDIDQAVIDDLSKACILFELKWFIEPAEVREVIEKTEELSKGVCQLLTLKRAFEENEQAILCKLRIESTYALYLALASENWIGHKSAQNPEVAIISIAHIIGKLNKDHDLRKTGEWLRNQEYLPVNAVHYAVVETVSTINKWTLNWYGIKPLLTDEFFPL